MSIAIGAITSFLGAWLAANLALKRFYKEKMWERKAAAYTTIFEALHHIRNWYAKNLDAYFEQRDISDEKTKELQKFANKAEAGPRRYASKRGMDHSR